MHSTIFLWRLSTHTIMRCTRLWFISRTSSIEEQSVWIIVGGINMHHQQSPSRTIRFLYFLSTKMLGIAVEFLGKNSSSMEFILVESFFSMEKFHPLYACWCLDLMKKILYTFSRVDALVKWKGFHSLLCRVNTLIMMENGQPLCEY